MLQTNKWDAACLAFGSARVKNNKPKNERRAENPVSVNVEARGLKPAPNGSPDSVKSRDGAEGIGGPAKGTSERFLLLLPMFYSSDGRRGKHRGS